MTSATEFENVGNQPPYSRINARWDGPDDELDNDNSSARLFERSRIKALADEREVVQKKTFTKWANSHLVHVSCRITDLYKDLRDGRMLIKLLEVLSGEMLVKPLPWALWLVLGPLCRKDTAWDLSTSHNLQ
ncbi:hypothetical protein E5288_WYG012570 [Bos mutus]|uniref:Calponin-homology (CH) domain-containing protein n=1 Tax=Bos mutus TaxID=72004 RepID=A0A6B0RZ53_9CETA|nr:hypothetical protein [Bos mutus]